MSAARIFFRKYPSLIRCRSFGSNEIQHKVVTPYPIVPADKICQDGIINQFLNGLCDGFFNVGVLLDIDVLFGVIGFFGIYSHCAQAPSSEIA